MEEARQPFEPDDYVQKQIESLLELLTRYGRGDLIVWDQVEANIGQSRHAPRAKYVITAARKRLQEDHQVVTRTKREVGIYFLTHAEAGTVAPKERQRRALGQVRRGMREVATVDTKGLTDHEQRLTAFNISALADSEEQIGRNVRRRWNKSQTNPRPT